MKKPIDRAFEKYKKQEAHITWAIDYSDMRWPQIARLMWAWARNVLAYTIRISHIRIIDGAAPEVRKD